MSVAVFGLVGCSAHDSTYTVGAKSDPKCVKRAGGKFGKFGKLGNGNECRDTAK